jgi:acyl dehydratase
MPRAIAGIDELRSLTGQEVATSDWLTVDQSHIQLFALATEDHQWIHLDVERARRESPYGETIAHGFLSLSLISHLSARAIEIGGCRMKINYGLNRVRFPAPVPAGSRIRGRFTLQSMEDVEGGVQLEWAVTVEIQGRTKPAVYAEWLVRAYPAAS